MRMLSGSPEAAKSTQNLLTEAKELRSISDTKISASALSLLILSFTFAAFFRSLAAITILTPLFAITLAVSSPIPDVAPFSFHHHTFLVSSYSIKDQPLLTSFSYHSWTLTFQSCILIASVFF